MKKAFVRLMALVLGLNVFTACYGPAPYPGDYPDDETVAQSDGSKADASEEAASGEAGAEENA